MAELVLKTCIGGAFYNKYIKASYKNEDMIAKMGSSELFHGSDHQRTLILNKLSDFVTDDHLRQFFSKKFKVAVKEVKIGNDKPMIIFDDEILTTGFLKACFKLGLKSRHSRYRRLEDEEFARNNEFRSGILNDPRKRAKDVHFSYDEIAEKLECEELRRPNHLYELRYETINKDIFVDFEMESINNFTYELNPRNLRDVTFACQAFYDKNGRFLSRSGTRLPSVPMVDVLFCLVFAPVVQVIADEDRHFFQKIICDGGETVVELHHVLTHYDIELIEKIRNMFNETMCREDNIKQAHMMNIDKEMQNLLSFRRLPLDVYKKLKWLEDEASASRPVSFKTKTREDEDRECNDANFFLEDVDMDEDGEMGDDEETRAILDRRDARLRQEEEYGYFLQPLSVQKLNSRILLYNDKVNDMMADFRKRLEAKRQIITKMKHRAKELSLKDTAIICARCQAEVGLLKTFRCVTPEKHHAKCSFGYLRRVEIAHCYEDPKKRFLADEANYGFIKLHMDSWGLDEPDLSQRNTQSSSQARAEGAKKPKYAFAECNNHHIVGYVEDDRFFLTDVSELKLMFPLGTYDDWCDKYWADQYRAAFEY